MRAARSDSALIGAGFHANGRKAWKCPAAMSNPAGPAGLTRGHVSARLRGRNPALLKAEAMPRPAVNVAVRAARSAGNIILRYMNRIDGLNVVEKQRMDFASEVDRLAEAEIVKELKRAYPTHAFLAEESGTIGKGPLVWVIDPLDGTHNYLRGIPHFSVSIALLDKGEPVYAVVFDPLRDELFTASKGDGAYLNDRRIRVTKRDNLGGAMIATGFPYRQRSHLDAQLDMTRALLGQAEDIRRSGSAALDLAYVAAGRYDGFFEIG